MPYNLRQAHQVNDRAVATAYGLENLLDNEPVGLSALLNLYKKFFSIKEFSAHAANYFKSF